MSSTKAAEYSQTASFVILVGTIAWPLIQDKGPQSMLSWVTLSLLVVWVITTTYLLLKKYKKSILPHEIYVVGKHFERVTIPLDGYYYKDCTFKDVTFKWNGHGHGCVAGMVTGVHRFETDNGAIADAIDILKALGFLEPSFANSWKRVPGSYPLSPSQ